MSREGALLAGLAAGIQCGPTGPEAGQAVLAAAPTVFAVGVGFTRLIIMLWRKLEPRLAFRFRPHGIVVAVLLAVAVPAMVFGQRVDRWFMAALWMFGTSYLALLFVTLRLWWWRSKSRDLTWAPVPPLVLMIAPAIPLAFGVGARDSLETAAFVTWIFAGYGGIVPGVLLAILGVEVVIRKRRRARA
jgi:hypothetical protein